MRPRYANDADLHRCRGYVRFSSIRRRINYDVRTRRDEFGWIVEIRASRATLSLIASLIASFSRLAAFRISISRNQVVPFSIMRLIRRPEFPERRGCVVAAREIEIFSDDINYGFQWTKVLKGPKILPSQQLGAAVAPWPGATGLIASVTADDMAHKGKP